MARLDRSARTTILALFPLFAGWLVLLPSTSSAGPGYVNFLLGQKLFDADDWDPIDKQPIFGAEGVFGPASWPLRIDAFVSRASKEKTSNIDTGLSYQIEGTTYEVGLGLNKTWTAGHLYPYLNAGGLYGKVDVTLKQSGTSASDDANGFGWFGGGGLFYRVGPRFNVGGAIRYSSVNADFNAFDTGNVSFGGADVEAGGITFGALLGWGWPATP